MTKSNKKLNTILWCVLILVFAAFVIFTENSMDYYAKRIVLLAGIYLILAMGLNIIYGFTGMFSLGQYGFMAIGAYVTSICYLPPEEIDKQYILQQALPIVRNVHMGFLPALIMGAIVSLIIGWLLGELLISKLGGDYLAIATLCFGEICRVIMNYCVSVTNGPMGLKGLNGVVNSYWIFGCVAIVILLCARIKKISHGRALFAIRENEIAAESSGINLLNNKVLAFAIGSMLSGIGGALMAFWSGTMDPTMFRMNQNFIAMMIVVIGGPGNITGSFIMSFIIAIMMEWLSFVEKPMTIFGWEYPGVYGVKMLVFAVFLLVIIINFKRGLFKKEFTPEWLYTKPKWLTNLKFKKKEK